MKARSLEAGQHPSDTPLIADVLQERSHDSENGERKQNVSAETDIGLLSDRNEPGIDTELVLQERDAGDFLPGPGDDPPRRRPSVTERQ